MLHQFTVCLSYELFSCHSKDTYCTTKLGLGSDHHTPTRALLCFPQINQRLRLSVQFPGVQAEQKSSDSSHGLTPTALRQPR